MKKDRIKPKKKVVKTKVESKSISRGESVKQHITIKIDNSKKFGKKISGSGGQRNPTVQFIPVGNSNPTVTFLPQRDTTTTDTDIFKILQTLGQNPPIIAPTPSIVPPIIAPTPSIVPPIIAPSPSIVPPIIAPTPSIPIPTQIQLPKPLPSTQKPENDLPKDDSQRRMPKNAIQDMLNNSEKVKRMKKDEEVFDIDSIKTKQLPDRRRVSKQQIANTLDFFVRNNIPIPFVQGEKEQKFKYKDRLDKYIDEHYEEVLNKNNNYEVILK